MRNDNLWIKKDTSPVCKIHTCSRLFKIFYDDSLSEVFKMKMDNFLKWVDKNYGFPLSIWIDFEDKKYYLSKNRKRTGYVFLWQENINYLKTTAKENYPYIRLACNESYYSFEDMLYFLTSAITCYYAYILDIGNGGYIPPKEDIDEVIEEYRIYRKLTGTE